MKNYDWQHQGATTAQIFWGCFKLQTSFVVERLFVGVMQQLTHLGTLEANNSLPEQHFGQSCVTPRIKGAITAQFVLWWCYNLQALSVREGLFAGVMQQLMHLGTLVAKNSMPVQHSGPVSSCVTPRIRWNCSTICLMMMLKSPTIIS